MQARTEQADASAGSAFGALQDSVRRAGHVAPELMREILGAVHARSAAPYRAREVQRIRRLIDAEAWTEVALALVEFDRSWAVRRIVYEDGEWHCTVGSQWPVPEWLDEAVVFTHELLPLAVVGALLSVPPKGVAGMPPTTSVPRFRLRPSDAPAVSCDNFA